MTNNPTIDGASRAAIEQALLAMKRIYQAGYDRIIDAGGQCDTPEYMMAGDPTARDLRALLDAPVVERKDPVSVLCREVRVLERLNDSIDARQQRIHALNQTPEVSALQSTIAQIEDKLNKAINLDFQRRETIAALEARIAELESGRGEVARYDRYFQGSWFEVAAGDVERFEKDGWKIRRLYTETYAKLNLPERRPTEFLNENRDKNIGLNACLDATAALNEVKP